jgi:hypothetical protein
MIISTLPDEYTGESWRRCRTLGMPVTLFLLMRRTRRHGDKQQDRSEEEQDGPGEAPEGGYHALDCREAAAEPEAGIIASGVKRIEEPPGEPGD